MSVDCIIISITFALQLIDENFSLETKFIISVMWLFELFRTAVGIV